MRCLDDPLEELPVCLCSLRTRSSYREAAFNGAVVEGWVLKDSEEVESFDGSGVWSALYF